MITLDDLWAEVRSLRADIQRRAPKDAYTRRETADRLSISISKLKAWIRTGVIVTCDDPTLIPAAEVLRLARPVEQPLGRRTHGRGRPSTYDAAAEAEKIRAGVRARKKR